MRRLLRLLGLIDLVWTQDFDGKLRLRTVWFASDGSKHAFGIITPPLSFNRDQYSCTLLEDGNCEEDTGCPYVKKWFPYESKPKRNHFHLNPFKNPFKK